MEARREELFGQSAYLLIHTGALAAQAGWASGVGALVDATPVRGARSLGGNRNGRAPGFLRRRFHGLLRFPIRFSPTLGHGCLPHWRDRCNASQKYLKFSDQAIW